MHRRASNCDFVGMRGKNMQDSGQRRSGIGAWMQWLIVALLTVYVYSQVPQNCLELKFAAKLGDLAAVKSALDTGVRADCRGYWVGACT